MRKKLSTILAADVAGYSRLIAEDEDDALRRLAVCRGALVDAVGRFRGRVFNIAGDGVLAEFESPANAVRCALETHREVADRMREIPSQRRMMFRIGIHRGLVQAEDRDLLGDTVNIAARLEGIAPPGGTIISAEVKEAVAGKLSVPIVAAGMRTLKNIPEPIAVYTVEPSARPQTKPTMALGWARRIGPMLAAAPRGFHLTEVRLANLKAASATVRNPSALASIGVAALVAVAGLWLLFGGGTEPPGGRSAAPATATVATSAVAGAPQSPPAARPISPATPPPKTPPPETTEAEPAKPGSVSDPVVGRHVLGRAFADCETGGPTQVIGACETLLREPGLSDADRARAYLNLGKARRETGAFATARDALAQSAKLLPTADAATQLGILAYDENNWAAAISFFDEAIKLDPKFGEAYNNRAWTAFKSGQGTSAMADADRAVELMPTVDYVWDTRAHINEAAGNLAAAERDYRKALSLNPGLASASAGLKRIEAAR